MMYALFHALLVTVTQLFGAYLRYLPFRRSLSAENARKLWRRLLLWSFTATVLSATVFALFATEIIFYKRLLLIGWIPYFLLSMTVIRNKIAEHLLVLGMQSLWVISLHGFVTLIESRFINHLVPEATALHTVFYLILALILLPLEKKIFSDVLPSEKAFTHKKYQLSFTLLPFVIYVGELLLLADRQVMGDMRVNLSMLVIPIFFVLLSRSLGIFTRQREDKVKEEQTIRLMKEQLTILQEEKDAQKNLEEQTLKLRRELVENYERLYELIDSGKIDEAQKYAQKKERLPYDSGLRWFCQSTLVNAALSIYLGQAEQMGIRVRQKVNLPPNFSAKESDFAALLSNLLENAIHAEEEQSQGEREISLVIKRSGERCVVELANRYDKRIDFNEDGLPIAKEAGHGLGIASLLSFAEKYDAYLDFSQENGWVRVLIYWEDKASR